jgi:hypothetical protein
MKRPRKKNRPTSLDMEELGWNRLGITLRTARGGAPEPLALTDRIREELESEEEAQQDKRILKELGISFGAPYASARAYLETMSNPYTPRLETFDVLAFDGMIRDVTVDLFDKLRWLVSYLDEACADKVLARRFDNSYTISALETITELSITGTDSESRRRHRKLRLNVDYVTQEMRLHRTPEDRYYHIKSFCRDRLEIDVPEPRYNKY